MKVLLDEFHKKMTQLLQESGTVELDDEAAEEVIELLREANIWDVKQDETLARMTVGGRSAGDAIRILTTGNRKAEVIITKYLSQKSEEVETPRPRRGRPRKQQ